MAFEYDGVIPSVRRSSFSYPTTHQFQAQVFDKAAHFGSDNFAIARASPHHVATLATEGGSGFPLWRSRPAAACWRPRGLAITSHRLT